MTILIIVFLISIISLSVMIKFRAWQIKTGKVNIEIESQRSLLPKIYFRQTEKIMLYLTKHIIQWVVLIIVKYWFILQTKIKKWIKDNSPKIIKFFGKNDSANKNSKITFFKKAIIESKFKIKHMKEKIIRENEEKQ